MERDLELIRKLVLAVEANPTGFVLEDLKVEGYSPEQIGYHCFLLVDAGLAKGIDATAMGHTAPRWRILHLTSAGHDFADASRDEGRWRKATEIVKDKAGTVTIDVMKQILVGLIRSTLGL